MSDTHSQADAGANDRFAARFFALVGSGDIGVGVLVVAYPPLLGWLIGQPLAPGGEVAARLLGCAAAALGLGWWRARQRPAARAALRAGLLVYNFGAGAVFVWAAIMVVQPLVPGVIGALHLALGIAAARLGTKVQ